MPRKLVIFSRRGPINKFNIILDSTRSTPLWYQWRRAANRRGSPHPEPTRPHLLHPPSNPLL